MKNTYTKIVFSLFSALALSSYGQLQTAGTTLVNIDATTLPLGPAEWVTNSGSLGGVFRATGLSANDQPVVNAVGGGTKGLLFDGHNFMEHATGPTGAATPAPADLVGPNPPLSIEAWVINPTFREDDGETIVAWGRRDAGMRNMAFNYSGNADHGAVDRWGGNMGWNPVPTPGQWHHLVMTFDGSVTRIYLDGVLNNTLANNAIDTLGGTPITLASQRNNDGTVTGAGGTRGSLTIGRLRIHDEPLTAAQVANNYNVERNQFVTAPAPLAAGPAHRYTFDVANTNDAVGLTIPDVGTAPGGAAAVQGFYGTASAAVEDGRVRLSGGSSETAPYIDLPNNLVSSLSTANGGSGQVTVEGWVNITGNASWHRLFDFGSTSEGEIEGPSVPGPTGTNMFMLAQVGGGRDWHQVEVNAHGTGSSRQFGLHNNNIAGFGLRHYAVTWNEGSGDVEVYANGVLSTRVNTPVQMSQIDDVNAWLGRSGYTADQNLAGNYDEFRIYNTVLTPAQIAYNYEAGPDLVLTDPGELRSVQVTGRTNVTAGTFQQLGVFGNYQNLSGLSLSLRPDLVFTSSNTNVVSVSPSGRLTALAPGNATVTFAYGGQTNTLEFTVTAESATLAHRYSFTTGPEDSVGGAAWNGALNGSAYVDGSQLVLDGSPGTFMQLPAGIITNQSAVTIEAWASFGTPLGTWTELFAFGDRAPGGEGRNYIMLTPHSGGNDVRASIAVGEPGGSRELFASRTGVLDGQSNVHLVAVYNPDAGYIALYINGALAGINNSVNIPLSEVDDILNLVGQSIWQADPHMNGSVDEFRIWYGSLSGRESAINAAAGPDRLVSDPGALQSLSFAVPAELVVNASGPSTLTGTFANVANVNLASFGATYTSGNTNVATVSANGVITAVAPGTTSITVNYGGMTQSRNVTVATPAAEMTHRYSFNGSTEDLVGNRDAQVTGSAMIVDNQLVLDASPGSYADLGADLVEGYHALTLEAWASFGANGNWVRLWDIGSQNDAGNGVTSIFFSPRTGNNDGEMTIFSQAGNNNIWPAGMGILDGSTNLHIVAVYNDIGGYQRLYFNGQLVAENTTPTVPLSTIDDQNAWLGRSLFGADPYLNGSIDEFRVYNGAVSSQQVAVNYAAGPDKLVSELGALQSVQFSVETNLLSDSRVQAQLVGNFANQAGVNLFAYAQPTLTSSDPNVVAVTPSGELRAVGAGQATVTAVYNGTSYAQVINVAAVPVTLKHRYTFDEPAGSTTAGDTVNDADATLEGGASLNGEGQMVLNGTTAYAWLPQGTISALSNATFEVWVTPTSTGNWQRIFDFGVDDGGVGASYAFLSARGAPGVRFTVKAQAGAPEAPILDAPEPLLVNERAHLVVVYNFAAGRASLYQNGRLVASGQTVTPLNAITDINNWLGRSQYAVDAYFAGTYDEFRIWEGAMQASQVAANFASGPEELLVPRASARLVGNQVEISWPKWGEGYTVQSTTTLVGASWQPVGGTPEDNGATYTLTVSADAQARFFRLVKQQ